ncbi:hypothetical protein [Algivirga pacifica]|uniref:Secretion system C-terminal sorting domain-containing protein n=1 Tax=Algivirga pacifica TaxID=1162670 RepID=A0ABP9DCK1_9BACT
MKKLIIAIFSTLFLLSSNLLIAGDPIKTEHDEKRKKKSKSEATLMSVKDVSGYEVAIHKHKEDYVFSLHFDKPESHMVEVLIKDEDDRVVFLQTFKKYNKVVKKFNLKNLPDGDYTIEIRNDDALVKTRGGEVVSDNRRLYQEIKLD